MKRLVYSPRAYVFIKDQEGVIHDVSRYVVGGTITRKLDQVSSAEFSLRNPKMIFTVHENDDGEITHPLFHPMDPVTVYLRRVRQRPVRVFTGFLDKTPYLSLFPGVVNFSASCTLKRLQHTYFDPALPYTQDFFRNYGWIDTGGGNWISGNAMPNPDSDRIGANATQAYSVGDSLGVGSEGPLAKELKGITIQSNNKQGRSTTEGIDILEGRVQRGEMPKVIIINLGTNDSDKDVFKAQIKRAMGLVGDNRHVIWSNISRPSRSGWDSDEEMNKVLAEAAQDYRNLTVLDWKGQVKGGKVKMASDGLHATADGYSARAAMIADAFKVGGGSNAKSTKQRADIDGSLSMLLLATLGFIGGWKPEDVYIEQLPNGLFERMRDMAAEFTADNEEARAEFINFIKDVVGSSSYGSESGSSTGAETASGTVKGADKIIPIIKRIAEKHGVDPILAVTAAIIESGLDGKANNGTYYGWYAQALHAPPYGNAGITTIPSREDAEDLALSCDLYCRAAAVRAKREPILKTNRYEWFMVTQGMKAKYGAPVQGPNGQVAGYFPQKEQQAKDLLAKYGNSNPAVDDASSQKDLDPDQSTEPTRTHRASRRDGREDKDSNSTEGKIYSPVRGMPKSGWPGPMGSYGASRSYGSHAGIDAPSGLGATWYSITDGVVEQVQEGWANGQPAVIIKTTQKFDGYPSPLYLGYGSLQSVSVSVGDEVSAGDPIGKGGTHGSGPHLHFWLSSSAGSTNGNINPTSFLKAAAAGEQPSGGPGTPSSDAPTGDGSGDGSGGGDNTLGAAAAGAFFGSLQLPSAYDSIEAALLAGEKSLMNDKPLLPFIQQLSQASLRHFQSLPDGRFYAFYPDYFGEFNQHPPYWEIDNIEILDGKVELSDDSLVTHQYVVGDTVQPMTGGSPWPIRSVFSSGVVTIFNAFMADSILDRDRNRKDAKDKVSKKPPANREDGGVLGPDQFQAAPVKPEEGALAGMNITLDRDEVAGFLERYGARPDVEDMAMIRNPYYEMFLAYQKFMLAWSRQFLTPFTFTFMPELYPGGKVGFPDHNLQMYIEEVQHSFSYEDGFTTTAALSAPSVYGEGKGKQKLPPNMVKAIIEPSRPERQVKRRKRNKKSKK